MGEEAVLMLVDGPAALPAVPLHEPTWYAVFYFLREVGTLQGSIDELASLVRSATTPEGQLEMLNRFQPDLKRLPQAEWDSAVYHVLDRAATVDWLMRNAAGREQMLIRSPVTLLQSADTIGQSFDRVTKTHCGSAMQHVKLGSSHTECLLTGQGQQEIATHLASTIQASLKLFFRVS